MTPQEREDKLSTILVELENLLARAYGTRCNFVLVITEGDESYVSSVTNTPQELAKLMLKSVYGRPYGSDDVPPVAQQM